MKRHNISQDGTGDKRQKTAETSENNGNNDRLVIDDDADDNDDHIRYQLRSSSNVTPVKQSTTDSRKQALVNQTKTRKGNARGKWKRRNNAKAAKKRLQRASLVRQSGANQSSVKCPNSAGKNGLVDKRTGDSLMVRFNQQRQDNTSASEGSDAGTFWTRLGWKFFSWIRGVSGTRQRVWLVPDANFFLQDKPIMQGIKDNLATKLGGGFCIGVSYTVVRELDAIKNDRANIKTPAERYLARQAIILLCKWFDDNDVCVKGENPFETAYARSKLAFPPLITNNDDEISEWCLQLRDKYGQSMVALLSEDKGFRVKANLHGLKAFSIVMLTEWLSSSSSSF